jgi:ribonuclease HI
MITELYVDGGVIAVNPSLIGGTYAWRLVHDDREPTGDGKVVTVSQMGGPVTNNQTEMLAMLDGLKQLPADWTGTIYSDSMVTLGRIFQGFKWKNIPGWMHKLYQTERQRLINWEQIKYVQLDGHPTRKQLAAGIGKRGNPVSVHNVWCDEACQDAGKRFMDGLQWNIPSTVDLSQVYWR